MKNKKVLKSKQLSAIKLLAAGTPAYQVAEKLEVSTMTIYRWQQLPEFEFKLQTITASGLEEIAKRLNSTALTAVETLQEVLCDMSLPTALRMKAALGVLNLMPNINGVLEQNFRNGKADFDLRDRWNIEGYAYGNNKEMSSMMTHAVI